MSFSLPVEADGKVFLIWVEFVGAELCREKDDPGRDTQFTIDVFICRFKHFRIHVYLNALNELTQKIVQYRGFPEHV